MFVERRGFNVEGAEIEVIATSTIGAGSGGGY
jgi:hypothetical protein